MERETKSDGSATRAPRGGASETWVALALLSGGMWVGWQLAPDYYDRGRLGLPMVLGAGWLLSLVVARRWSAARPVFTATLCVLPWSLALSGLSYIGFFLLVPEVLTTAHVLRLHSTLSGVMPHVAAALIRLGAATPVLIRIPGQY